MTEATDRIDEARPRRFRPYSAYRDSGVEWLGEIPEDWESFRLRFVVKTSVTKKEVRELDPETKVSFVPMEAVGEYGGLDLDATKPLSEVIDGYTYFRNGDVIVAKITPCFENGKGALASRMSSGIGFGTTELHVLRPSGNLDARFLLYLTFSDHFRRIGTASMFGAGGQKRISDDFIRNFRHPVPGLSEQRAITAFLDRETARIDGLVARKERLIELLQEKRTALITRAVTRGLDPNAPMKDSGLKWLGEIPAHWEVKRLRHIMRHIEQGWSPDCENREAGADEWGVLKAGCVNRGTFLESEHKALPSTLSPIPALEIRKGDLLMSRASGSRDLVGSVAVVSECRPHLLLCDKVFRLHTESSAGHRQFIGYAMNSRIVRWQIESAISGGSGLASNISQEAVKDLVVVQPPRSERWEIAGYLDCETTRIDALIAKVRQAIDHLKEFRTALISAAVTGKIDVREEAP